VESGKGARVTQIDELKRHRLTLPQAARILGTDAKQIRKTIERGPLKPTYVEVGKRRHWRLDGLDIVYLRLCSAYSPMVRREMYGSLKAWPANRPLHDSLTIRVNGQLPVEIPLRRAVGDTLTDLNDLEQSESIIEADAGAALIRGTGVEAHRIAALVEGGMPTSELLRDYPGLTRTQVEAAVAYAKAHPKQGRPFPSRTVKSVLRRGDGGLRRAFATARDTA
jgi:uncharacterized protein (DUF433 family)